MHASYVKLSSDTIPLQWLMVQITSSSSSFVRASQNIALSYPRKTPVAGLTEVKILVSLSFPLSKKESNLFHFCYWKGVKRRVLE